MKLTPMKRGNVHAWDPWRRNKEKGRKVKLHERACWEKKTRNGWDGARGKRSLVAVLQRKGIEWVWLEHKDR